MKKIAYVITSTKKSGPIQVLYNLISKLNREKFEPILITLYNDGDNIGMFLNLNLRHYSLSLSKKDILLNNIKSLELLLNELEPDIIHSMGVFPDYAISKLNYNSHVVTLHNFMDEDYVQKFGLLKGNLLKMIQMRAVSKARRVWVCSKSLQKMYQDRKGVTFDCIQNGVDIVSDFDKEYLRKQAGISSKDIVFIYAAQFIDRKNQKFLIEQFLNLENPSYKLFLLGDGVNYFELQNRYKNNPNILFIGRVDNPYDYYKISDICVSSSLSEGLPTSVLESMSCALPVLLSSIPQHEEFFEYNYDIGNTFSLNEELDFHKKVDTLLNADFKKQGEQARRLVQEYFSSQIMSDKYQDGYLGIINENKS